MQAVESTKAQWQQVPQSDCDGGLQTPGKTFNENSKWQLPVLHKVNYFAEW